MNKELENEEIKFNEVKNKYVQTFFKDLTDDDKKNIYFDDYMWHVFTYGKIACIEGYDAVKEFKKRNQNDVYVISIYSGIVEERKNLTYEGLLRMRYMNSTYNDCYVVDKNFRWTFIFTHETLPNEDIEKQIMQNKIEENEVPYYIGPFFKSLDNDCVEKIIDSLSNDEQFIVINNFKPNKYNELIEYCFENSDFFSLTKYNDPQYILTNNVIKFILGDKKVTKEDILNTNTDEMVFKLRDLYKSNIIIYKARVLQQLHLLEIDLLDLKKQVYPTIEIKLHYDEHIKKKQQEIKEKKQILELIEHEKLYEEIDNSGTFDWIIKFYKYDCFTSDFLEKYKNKIYSIDEKYGLWGKNDKDLYTTTYKFKVCDETKKILLQDFNDIYDWYFPDYLEDLCFYRNNEIWLSSTSHEQDCLIKPKDEIEEEYIKSLAIETTDNDSDM